MSLANLFNHPQFLRRVLLVDAVAGAGMGALMLAAAAPLSTLLGLPAALLQGASAILLPFAVFLAWLALRAEQQHRDAFDHPHHVDRDHEPHQPTWLLGTQREPREEHGKRQQDCTGTLQQRGGQTKQRRQ
ncbi:MAG TPA: hypothetical protein VM555_07560, partial [Tahibacter sp.]|nr:hypothetical protein [Tahibacter sp.]